MQYRHSLMPADRRLCADSTPGKSAEMTGRKPARVAARMSIRFGHEWMNEHRVLVPRLHAHESGNLPSYKVIDCIAAQRAASKGMIPFLILCYANQTFYFHTPPPPKKNTDWEAALLEFALIL